MKKLTLVTLISSALSAGAMAGNYDDKISHSFNDLDADGNGYISEAEANDGNLKDHWDTMNTDGNDVISSEEYYTHIANNPSHYTDSLVASAQVEMNGMQEVDPKTVSSAGDDEIALEGDTEIEESSSMTVKAEGDNMKDVDKEYEYSKDVDVDADSDELAMDDDDAEADYEKETTMTVKTEEDNMGGEQNVTVEKDVDVDVEGDASAIASTEFDDIDTDADGKLTKAEIADAADKVQFHEIDINNDEMVSRAEFDSYKRTSVTTEDKEYDDEY